MRLSVLRVLSLLSVVAGCTLDYGVSGEKNQPGADTGTSSSDTDGDPRRDECPDPDTTPIDVQIDESCEAPPEVGAWTPVVEWTSSAVGDSYASPVVGQLTDDNGDGVIDDQDMPDIVVAGTGGLISVISGDGSRVHWQGGNLGSEPSTPAIADLDNDGRPEVIATGSTGAYAFRGDSGQVYWSNAQVGSTQFICGGVAVADLEGDGRPEIIQGGYVLEGRTGNLRFRVAGMGTGYTGSTFASFGVAADIDQDGDQEVVTGNAIYDASGNELWSTRQNDGFVAVANFDRDPAGEMVVSWYPGMVRLQDDDGTVLWSGSYTGNTVGPPTIADFDGDGEPEIGVAGNGVYVVIETDGTRKWTRNVVDYSSGFTGSSVFDFEGDGKAEVVYADENDLWVFNGENGQVKLQETFHSSATCSENPTIADVDNDGQAEIIYTSSNYSQNVSGVTVVGDQAQTWRPAPTIWNQHAWSITNVSNSAGSIPRIPATNWLLYNNFRSGDLASATGGVLPDAAPVLGERCDIECADGRVRVSFYVGSMGMSELPAGVNVSLYAKQGPNWNLLETRAVSGAIGAGTSSEALVFDIDTADLPADTVKFVVDDAAGTQALSECHEDNNEIIVEGLCE